MQEHLIERNKKYQNFTTLQNDDGVWLEGTQSDEHIKSYFTALFSTNRERGSMAFLETIENRLSN